MAAKKSFKGSLQAEKEAAAEAFLSQLGRDPEKVNLEFKPEKEEREAEKAWRREEKLKNRKTDRLNLTLPPHMKDDLRILSYIERRAATQIINELVGEYLDKHRDKINQYKELFGDGGFDDE